MFNGEVIQVNKQDNIAIVTFNNKVQSSNVFNQQTLGELEKVLTVVKTDNSLEGLIFSSAKNHFILGADITEFLSLFKMPDEELSKWLSHINDVFTGFEDLPFPTVSAINGFALGGGFEITLTTSFRIASTEAKLGLPETKLGIIPGWGGTCRLPRLTGADHAIEWITSGKQYRPEDCLKIGVLDGVVAPENLIDASKTLIARANAGDVDWKAKNQLKMSPLKLNSIESSMVFETAKAFVFGIAGKNYPAPIKAIKVMQDAREFSRAQAIELETKAFVECARTAQAESLITVFLGDQYVKKVAKKVTKGCDKIGRAAVLGAGIMGGGIAYQSASKGVPILMKDINNAALDLGMSEANQILGKLAKRGRINQDKYAQVISAITPTLSYGDFGNVDIIVEAVVENEQIKASVISELENKINENTIIASNTSTISITRIAKNLKRPENFCGMHFFNPVHKMPLVEIIRGEKTSDEAIAKTVQYALQMGKTPIVVNDCPGFLVNRVLFPYFNGFIKLIEDGVDFKRMDRVMEKFGWPMGPAYLLDVVGVDTAHHCVDIMGADFPDRMAHENETVLQGLFESERFGQKNGKGFYEYVKDKRGRAKKTLNEDIYSLVKKYYRNEKEVSDEEIVERMMIPMIIECVRCLDENIVGSPMEVDMGLLMGLGFPPFRAGALKYADSIGLANLVEKSQKYVNYGHMYTATKSMVHMAENNELFYKMGV
jgi:3-hydroxyacyl-CoA dehydrogenase / enoyl-CoA hydratase / 3-hydroxybutyryl-CoA epimerase / enoyl-CoA isomerase